MLFSVKADAFGSAAKQFKPHGSALRRGRGGERKAPSSLPQERNPLHNKKVQLILTPKSNEIKRNQISLTNIHSPYYNITVAIATHKIRKE